MFSPADYGIVTTRLEKINPQNNCDFSQQNHFAADIEETIDTPTPRPMPEQQVAIAPEGGDKDDTLMRGNSKTPFFSKCAERLFLNLSPGTTPEKRSRT